MVRSGTIETVADLVQHRALHQAEKIAFTYLEDRGEGEGQAVPRNQLAGAGPGH